MPREGEYAGRSFCRAPLIAAALLVVFAMVLAALFLLPPRGSSPPSATASSDSTGLPGDQSMVVETSERLTVPETLRLEPRTFTAHAGQSYLLKFEIATVKPEGSPGAAMYFGANLACGSSSTGTTRSIGGTQNLVTGERVTLSNQFILSVDATENQACRVVLSSPNESAAAVGTTVDVDVRWTMTSVPENAHELDSDRRLPLVVEAGDSQIVFRETVPRLVGESVNLIGSLHVTACTMVNGSREGGETFCDEASIDSGGSSFDVEASARVLDSDGETCGSAATFSEESHVGRHVHHQLLPLRQRVSIPEASCADRVELLVIVTNEGPAPLVVHGSSSSYIAVPEGAG